MPKIIEQPRLTNRGTAGLLHQLDVTPELVDKRENQLLVEQRIIETAPKDRFAPSLLSLVVSIDSIQLDPRNARVHNERNLRAIMLSFAQFGQRKPISVHRDGMVTMAGNGTLEALKALGWTKVAAAIDDDLNEAEAIAYGLADNRTAELAKWDFETVARLDKLVTEAGLTMPGWTMDELEVLRAADWTPPVIDEGFGTGVDGGGGDESLLYSFTPDNHQVVHRAVEAIRTALGTDTVSREECVAFALRDWLESKQL